MTLPREAPLLRPTLVGRTIAGKYAVEALLGSGAMGEVYRARQVALDKKIALKVMHAAVAMDPAFADRFEREAKAASRLDHPNSIRVIDFGKEPDGLTYIAMEYVEGRNLHELIQAEWPLSRARIANLLIQATSALTVAHDMGVVHRDLKPENLMVIARSDEDGHSTEVLKVLDFGIAKLMSRSGGSDGGHGKTTAGMLIGTPEYMSPEQCRGDAIDARTDIYSIGVILFELLTRTVPFTADTAIGTVVKHITMEAPRPSQVIAPVDPELEAICVKAMSKAREDRYQSARELRAALRASLDARAPSFADAGPVRLVSPDTRTSVAGAAGAATLSIDVMADLVPASRSASAATLVQPRAPSGAARWVRLGLIAAGVFALTRFSILWIHGDASRLPGAAAPGATASAVVPTSAPPPTAAPSPASLDPEPTTGSSPSAPAPRPAIPPSDATAHGVPSGNATVAPAVASPVQPSRGRARLTVTHVSGATDGAVKASLPLARYQDCYQAELRRAKKGLEGHADLKIAFLPSGTITSAQGLASAELSAVGQCSAEATLHALRGVRDVDASGGTADVTIEFTLE